MGNATAGARDVALCLGAEKLTHEDKTMGTAPGEGPALLDCGTVSTVPASR